MLTKRKGYEPMRPVSLKPHERWDFGKPGWLYQIKYDGYRALLYKEQAGCRLESKDGNDLLAMRGSFEALCNAVASELKAKDIVLDGEAAVLDESGRADFWALMGAKKPLVYAVFDILRLRGKDVRHLPLTKRLALLRKELPESSSVILRVEAVEGDVAADIYRLVCEQGIEGLVAKRAESPYDPTRKSAQWYKVLNRDYSLAQGKREFFNQARKKTAR